MASRRQQRRGVPRWLAWTLGLVAAAAGLWALVGRDTTGGPPLDDVDAASRERLEEVLREAGPDAR